MTYNGTHETGHAPVNNGSIYYERMGLGTPILMLHGYNLDTRMWNRSFSELAKTNQVILMDLRPFGQSAPTTEPYSVYEDIRALLDYLGVKKTYLVGHSLGGSMSLEFAMACPERVLGIVLNCGGLRGAFPASKEMLETRETYTQLVEQLGGDVTHPEAIDLDLKFLLNGPNHPDRPQDPELMEYLRVIRTDAFKKPFNGNFPKPFTETPIDLLDKIEAPVLATWGDLDWPDFKQVAELLVERCPNARRRCLEGTAHQGCMERPDDFNRLVLDFITTNEN